MKDWKERYYDLLKLLIIAMIILALSVIFLGMNIKIRDEKIWQQSVEIEDLKEQIRVKESEGN